MTAPTIKKPTIFSQELQVSEILRREFAPERSPEAVADLLKAPLAPVSTELFRIEALPSFRGCGVLRNNSAFGCSYLDSAGRENKLGVNFDTYRGGFGLSLKFFLGGS